MENFDYKIINDEINCDIMCNELSHEEYIAIDTEFFTKQNSFHLSTIQISSSNSNYLIDFDFQKLIKIPTSLKVLLENANVIKIFHAHQQDYQILRETFNVNILNIFDTQIAMMFLSATEIYSYRDIVAKFLQLKIEKLHKNDDWEKKPLSESQIHYAISDTFYLYKIYPMMLNELEVKNRLSWMKEYMIELIQSKNLIKVDELINKYNILIKNIEQYHKLKLLYEILNKKIPLHLLKNLIESKNITENRIYHIINIEKNILEPEIIKNIVNILKKTYTDEDLKNYKICNYKEKMELTNEETQIFLILKHFLKKISIEYTISTRLICEKQDLIKLIKNKENYLMKSWRFEIFGRKASELLRGERMILIKNSTIDMI